MSFNKTIQMIIFDNNPNGMIMCELSNWNGRVFKISRTELNRFYEREESGYTGVYFLMGRDDDNADTIYIGETEVMQKRLNQHLNDSNYWNDAIVVISKDNNLNKAHVKYLENIIGLLYQKSRGIKKKKSKSTLCPGYSRILAPLRWSNIDAFIE